MPKISSKIIFFTLLGIITLVGAIYFYKMLLRPIPGQETIYVVNMQKIREEIPATKQIQEDLQKILEKYHQQLTKIEAELKAEHQELISAEKGQLSMAESHALEKRKATFEAKVAETQKNVEVKQQSINTKYTLAMEKLQTIMQDKVKEVAEEEGVQVILSAQQLIYATHSRDLTSKVYEKVKAATQNFHMEQSAHD